MTKEDRKRALNHYKNNRGVFLKPREDGFYWKSRVNGKLYFHKYDKEEITFKRNMKIIFYILMFLFSLMFVSLFTG